MSIELPVLRLGLVGFTAQQQEAIASLVGGASLPGASWRIAPLAEADAWWVNGARTHPVGDGTLRVNPGTPTARSVQLNLEEADRPVAFAKPLPAVPLDEARTFNLTHPEEALRMLAQFTAWLSPLVAQFGLASAIVDNHSTLGSGVFQVFRGSELLAVVNLRGNVGVLPSAGVADFEDAFWRHDPMADMAIPERFSKLSLSQLMWQYAMRTQRDLLPPHYRTGLIYFRRPPRIAQRMLHDTHLLVLRELAAGCATAQELQERTTLPPAQLHRDLAALYMVGAITSNAKRAAKESTRRPDGGDSLLSSPTSLHPDEAGPQPASDLTAPAPLRPQ